MPPALASLIDQTSLAEIEIGMSEARVFSADSPAGTPFYLKVASTASIDNLRDEQTRLLWLQKDLPVPEVVHFEEFEGVQYLLLTAVPGVVSFHESLRDRLPDVVLTVGESLRLIHALPIDECPFDTRLAVRLDAAKNRLRSGQIRRELFEAPNQGIEPAALYDRLVAHIPEDALAEDAVVSHLIGEQGCHVRYAPQAEVFVKYPTTYHDWLKQRVRSAGGYAQPMIAESPLRMRSFWHEALNGPLRALRYPRTPREFLWSLALFGGRLHLWLLIFWRVRIRRLPLSALWQRVESTK